MHALGSSTFHDDILDVRANLPKGLQMSRESTSSPTPYPRRLRCPTPSSRRPLTSSSTSSPTAHHHSHPTVARPPIAGTCSGRTPPRERLHLRLWKTGRAHALCSQARPRLCRWRCGVSCGGPWLVSASVVYAVWLVYASSTARVRLVCGSSTARLRLICGSSTHASSTACLHVVYGSSTRRSRVVYARLQLNSPMARLHVV